MFSTRLSRLLARLVLIIGALKPGLGFYVAQNQGTQGFDASRYLFAKTSGEAVEGLMLIAGAIVPGVITDISRSLHRTNDRRT